MITERITERSQHGVRSVRRRLVVSSGIYGATSIALRFLGFALLTVYSKFISPGDYGVVSLVESAALIIGMVSSLGLESGSRRLYFHFSEDPAQLSGYVSTVIRLAIAAFFITILITFLGGSFLVPRVMPALGGFFPYFALAIFSASATQLLETILVFYQCEERTFAYSAFTILQATTSVLFTALFVVWMRWGALGLLMARACGVGLSLLIAGYLCRPRLSARPAWRYARDTLRLSLPLVPHLLMAVGLVAADRYILEHYRPMSEVGIYALSYNIGMVMAMITGTVLRAWAPLLYGLLRSEEAERIEAAEIFADIMGLLAAIAVIGALVVPICVHTFLAPNYWPSDRVAPIVLGAYLCHSLFALFRLLIIHARRPLLVSIASSTALVFNIALNYLWIPRYGMTGAAYATFVGYLVEAILIAAMAVRVVPLPLSAVRRAVTLMILGAALGWTALQSRLPDIPLLPTAMLIGGIGTVGGWVFVSRYSWRSVEN